MEFNKGAELDKQIYEEGESTWGCKDGVLDVEDVKQFVKNRIYDSTKLLALFNQGKLTSMHLREHRQTIKDDAGEALSGLS